MLKSLLKKSVIAIFSFLFFTPLLLAVEEAIPVNSPHEGFNKAAVKEEVKILRKEEQEKMPYLNRAYIRSSIRREKVEKRMTFVSGSQKQIQDLVERAMVVDTPTRAARERISLARRRILVALRALFPEVNLEIQKREGTLSGDAFNSRNYRFAFRQPVFRSGMLWNALLQEQAGLEAAQKEYEKIISDLVNDVSSAYFEYQRALKVKKEQEEDVEKLRRFVGISKQKMDQQIISEIEYLNTLSLFGQIEYDYEASKQELELAKLDIQKYLDVGAQDNIDIVQMYDINDLLTKKEAAAEKEDQKKNVAVLQNAAGDLKKSVVIPNLNVMVDLAYEHRPELQIESAKLQSARLEERVRWGDLMPHVDVVLEFGKLGEAFNQQDLEPGMRTEYRLSMEFTWNMGGNRINYTFEHNEQAPSVSQFQGGTGTLTARNTASFGLLDGLETFAEVKEAEIARLDQVIELEKAEKEVIHDVKQAYYDYQKASIQVESTMKRADYRKRLALLAEHRLGKNEVQISEYLQAENDYSHDLAELHKALKDYFTARAQLNHALGMRNFLKVEEKYGK